LVFILDSFCLVVVPGLSGGHQNPMMAFENPCNVLGEFLRAGLTPFCKTVNGSAVNRADCGA
jgi:hypothetical protein